MNYILWDYSQDGRGIKSASSLSSVIAGLDPAIHEANRHRETYARFCLRHVIMDARVKPGHDAEYDAPPSAPNKKPRRYPGGVFVRANEAAIRSPS